jgi:DNA-directed RNA polymerase subunit RPC12/RpoP
MAIRFRCAYCSQLMGISHRKVGAVVRCPRCSGQVVVPATSVSDHGSRSSSKPTTPMPQRGVFDRKDFGDIFQQPASDEVPQAIDVELMPMVYGVFLTPWRIFLLVLFVLLLTGFAFLAGWLMGSESWPFTA